MKGEVFVAFEDFLNETFGEGTYDIVVENTKLKTTDPFVKPGTYPDEDLIELVKTAVGLKNLDLAKAITLFGEFLFFKLIENHPKYSKQFNNVKDFLKALDGIIHVEVKKLYPDAMTPAFTILKESPNSLTLKYQSKRNLFPLVIGLLQGVAKHFKENVSINTSEINETKNYGIYELTFN